MRSSMKVVIAILAMAAVVMAATDYPSSGTANRGYTTQRSVTIGGWLYVSYTLDAADLSSTNGATTILQVVTNPQGSGNIATVNWYWAFNSIPDATSPRWGSKSVTDQGQTMYIPVYNITDGMSYGNGSGTYTIAGNMLACSTCTGSPKFANFYFDTQLQFKASPSAAAVTQPFPAIHNPYTIDYSTSQGAFAIPSARLVLTATTNIYVKLDMPTLYSATQKLAMTFKNGSLPVTSDYATIQRYPSGSLSSGTFTTGAISLAAGTWYITPYCGSASGSTNCVYDFAIGIGSLPASARMITPSLFIAALVAATISWLNL